MYTAETHLMYQRERHADVVRAARKSQLADAVGASRTNARRFYLTRLWERRFATSPQPATDLS